MDSSKPSVDLERELMCSICTELLYQPLTLLDCLHTFCGACLKEWFSFQATTAERAPSPPPPGTPLFTCPSCRAPVRDTKPNATVRTLLDMFVAANPTKARPASDIEEMAKKYSPGDQVLPQVNIRGRTAEETRAADEDRRLVEEVRLMSLRDGVPESSSSSSSSRRRRASHSADDRPRSSGHRSATSDARRPRDGSRRPRPEDGPRRSADQLLGEGERHRRRRSESRNRQVEHQSSLRSLIGSTDMSERDMEREIADFARQIQEEGLLDGLDLDNIDLTRDDELSRRITEAYRRRQRARARPDTSRRRNSGQNTGPARASENNLPDTRLRASNGDSSRASRSRHARSVSVGGSASSQAEERTRPSTSTSTGLDARDAARRPGPRTASRGRSETTPVFPSASETQPPASRSQTDLRLQTQPRESMVPLPLFHSRSPSSSSIPQHAEALTQSPVSNNNTNTNANANANLNPSFAARVPQVTVPDPAARGAAPPSRAAELAVVYSYSPSLMSGNPSAAPQPRSRSQLYPEPSITCSKCNRQHIEYEVHYNCGLCSGGQWNLCLDCYRSGKGCRHWFGFGYGAWNKWERVRQKGELTLPPPHELTACRYQPPPSTPGGADGRKTLTTSDPILRLEQGTFCARCFEWTNECYWRCDVCNEGEWGFCNNCVNQGRSCSHMLLPLIQDPPQPQGRPASPKSHGPPPSASILTGPQASNFGPFKPLTFKTHCDICQDPIPPAKVRFHCFSCTSSLVQDSAPGDYDICVSCYNSLVTKGQISEENGPAGWRRCLNGHRMVIIGFTAGKVGQWRFVDRDLVGGRALRSEPFESSEVEGQDLQKWTWQQGDQKWERLVTKDVSLCAPSSVGSVSFAQTFPPDGGSGMRAAAKFAWYPAAGADDELLFPRGAEVREIEDVNGDWFFGTYMGAKGLFPSPYVRLDQDS